MPDTTGIHTYEYYQDGNITGIICCCTRATAAVYCCIACRLGTHARNDTHTQDHVFFTTAVHQGYSVKGQIRATAVVAFTAVVYR